MLRPQKGNLIVSFNDTLLNFGLSTPRKVGVLHIQCTLCKNVLYTVKNVLSEVYCSILLTLQCTQVSTKNENDPMFNRA